jgi:hypothetical protein
MPRADLGDDDLGGVPGDAGDLLQPAGGRQRCRVRAAAGLRAGGPVGADALRGGDRGDQLPGPGAQGAGLRGEAVDLGQQDGGQLAVVGTGSGRSAPR